MESSLVIDNPTFQNDYGFSPFQNLREKGNAVLYGLLENLIYKNGNPISFPSYAVGIIRAR